MSADFLCFDFETLGRVPYRCTVASFGACAGRWSDVKIDTTEDIKETIATLRRQGIELFFDIKDQKNRKSDKETLEWWSNQDPKSMKYVFKSEPRINIEQYYDKFKEFAKANSVNNKTVVLVRAPHFDETISQSIMDTFGQTNDFYSHWLVRDTRTIVDTVAETNRGHLPGFEQYMTKNFGMKKHCALDDTIIDVLEVAFCYAGAKENDFRQYKD